MLSALLVASAAGTREGPTRASQKRLWCDLKLPDSGAAAVRPWPRRGPKEPDRKTKTSEMGGAGKAIGVAHVIRSWVSGRCRWGLCAGRIAPTAFTEAEAEAYEATGDSRHKPPS
eukprot:7218632-Pyramimonas_sp.AAC.1